MKAGIANERTGDGRFRPLTNLIGLWLLEGTLKSFPKRPTSNRQWQLLIGVSACMSLMFPTIYGIALEGTGEDAKFGSAGLILAIGGGCLMPPMQAAIMDMDAFSLGSFVLSSTRVSFALPLICFIAIATYGFYNRPRRA